MNIRLQHLYQHDYNHIIMWSLLWNNEDDAQIMAQYARADCDRELCFFAT